MCGFSVINSSQSIINSEDIEKIKKSLDLIKHRGPDSQRIVSSKNNETILAHARLSIIDINNGNQPMTDNSQRFSIVFNGEIYNYKEIKKDLGLNTRTESDTEVVLLSFIQLKERCLDLLRGMFTFCIWDDLEKTLFIARDRFGIKPLYYSSYKSGIIFSSEIKGILPFISSKKINYDALSDYFNFQFCLEDRTLFKGINQFPSSSYAYIKDGKIKNLNKYWKVNYEIDYSHDEKWFIKKIDELIKESIFLHCRADVEIASYISGGIDSTLVSLLSRNYRNSQNPQSFIGRYTTNIGFDESEFAIEATKNTNLNCNVITITPNDFLENIESLIWHLDQPIAGPGSFGQYMVAKEVSKTHKVILGGQGGDEIFGGYVRYLIIYLESCLKDSFSNNMGSEDDDILLENIIPNLSRLASYEPLLKEFFSSGLFENLDLRYWRLINKANNFNGLINEEILNNGLTKNSFKALFSSIESKSSKLNKMLNFDTNSLLPALLHVEDRVSMANGLEARVPFLDHKIIELLSSVPTSIKFKSGSLKNLLKECSKNYIHKNIIFRKDKMGFPIPINLWFKENKKIKEFLYDTFKSKKSKDRSYFNKKFDIERLITQEGHFSRNLWGLLCLEIWQQKFID